MSVSGIEVWGEGGVVRGLFTRPEERGTVAPLELCAAGLMEEKALMVIDYESVHIGPEDRLLVAGIRIPRWFEKTVTHLATVRDCIRFSILVIVIDFRVVYLVERHRVLRPASPMILLTRLDGTSLRVWYDVAMASDYLVAAVTQ